MLPIVLSCCLLLPSIAQQDPPPGAAAAYAAREAARYEVLHNFWTEVARAVNAPDRDLRQRLLEAWDTRRTSLALISRQHDLRVQLIKKFGNGGYQPQLIPSEFSADITNPYLPHIPGRKMIYERQTSEGLERIEVTTLNRIQYINGIPCRPVMEYETLDGVLMEQTVNWISQHQEGAVWYLGEIAQIYEDGFLSSLSGSWRYGTEGAQPGILMPAQPVLGDHYRQEFKIGVAEDVAHITAVQVTEMASGHTFTNCVTTEERTPIEPDDVGSKTYAPGVGLVVEVDQKTGERLELVKIVH